MKRLVTVELLTSIVTAVLACGIGGAFLRWGVHRRTALQVSRGALLPPLKGYAWSSHERTLVLALRAGCPYCQESMGFYARLLGVEHCGGIAFHVLAIFPDSTATAQQSLPPGLRDMQMLPNVDLAKLRIAGTPTLILVDASGRAQEVWVGQLSPEGQNQVLRALRSPPRGATVRGECSDREALAGSDSAIFP